jgi:hypothetical protein
MFIAAPADIGAGIEHYAALANAQSRYPADAVLLLPDIILFAVRHASSRTLYPA